MRACEFINESFKRGKPDANFSHANPGVVGPTGQERLYAGRYYDFYRISNLAGLSAEALAKTDVLSYLGNLPMYQTYTPQEHEILVKVLNKLGLKPQDYIPTGSTEMPDIQRVSPIAAKKTNRYGV